MKSRSIKFKLGFLCGFLLIVILAVGMGGLRATEEMTDRAIELADVEVPAVRNMSLVDMMHDSLMGVVYRSIFISDSNDSQKKNEVSEELKELSKNVEVYLGNLAELNVHEETKAAIEEAKPALNAYVRSASEIVGLALSGQKDQASGKITEFQKSFAELESKLGVLGDLIEKDAERSRDEAKKASQSSKNTMWFFMIAGVLIGLITSFIFTASLSKNLMGIASQLTDAASQVSESSVQMAAASQGLSQASTEQAAALSETTASLEQIAAMITKAAESAETSAQTSTESLKKAEEGQQASNQMLHAMEEISKNSEVTVDQIKSSNQQMSEIVRVIQEIGNKTKVINEIVFQTKLLSFNASVEAARAGEYGKGFAVVAEEVGNLALMSGTAAKEITEMLDSSVAKVESIVSDTNTRVNALVSSGNQKVEAGVQMARRCSEVLNEIITNVHHVSELSSEISLAMKEQSLGVSEINKAMSQLDIVTQQNSATSEESAKTASALAENSSGLKNTVIELLVTVEGDNDQSGRQTQLAS